MPSRKDLFDAIDKTPVTEKSYEELKQRKVVNDFTKMYVFHSFTDLNFYNI